MDLKGKRESIHYVNGVPTRVQDILGSQCIVQYRKDLQSMDTEFFLHWSKQLCKSVQNGRDENVWIILFYDAI